MVAEKIVSESALRAIASDIKEAIDAKPEFTDLTGTLTAGNTSITFSDASITTNSTIDYYPKSEYYGINPVGVSVRTGSVTLTFEAQDIDLDVKVRLS